MKPNLPDNSATPIHTVSQGGLSGRHQRLHRPMPPPWYYRWAVATAAPLYRLWLYSRRQQLPHFAREIAERFGYAYRRPVPQAHHKGHKKIIWCHAVSLGEMNTVYPLLASLLSDGYGLYITNTTQTGFARAQVLFTQAIASGQVVHGFLPVDVPAVLARFVRRVNPHLALFVETELWANTLYVLAKSDIPALMVNARLNEKSFEGYHKFPKLAKSMMTNLSLVIAQDQTSAARFMALGLRSEQLAVADSLKWSIHHANPNLENKIQQLAQRTGLVSCTRPIWLAGSTHEGEEQACLMAHRQLLLHHPEALLVIVPRHPERFEQVVAMCADSGMSYARHSQATTIAPETQVYVVDGMGELDAWYGLCDVALVAGSLVDVGGHNPIEAASVAKPIIMGRYVRACDLLVAALKDAGALIQVQDDKDVASVVAALMHWLGDKTAAVRAGQAGQALVSAKQNAMQQQKALLQPFLR